MKSEEGLGDESFLYKQTGDTGGLVPRRPIQRPAWFHSVFNTVLKVKNGMVVSVSVVAPLDGVADWELSLLPLSITRGSYCIL